ncbi:hypothetical protein ACGF5M_04475 [Gemmatimonadota bacterium]
MMDTPGTERFLRLLLLLLLYPRHFRLEYGEEWIEVALSLVASFVPARRASRITPMEVLREE